ncbi:hypothetical protein DKP75_07155 [Fructilactobacillus sanfranciscensis]|nr:hypothetical protein DKP75_07155 [Fructilactobacillus sanfranciscensis]
MSFVAPVFYSLNKSPLLIKVISGFNPLTYQIQAIRSIVFGHFSSFLYWNFTWINDYYGHS